MLLCNVCVLQVDQPGCRHKGPCKYMFPMDVQLQRQALRSANQRVYHYFRPRYCDRNVVPYHPSIALLWGAHTNMQRITNDAWSYYILKYAMKV